MSSIFDTHELGSYGSKLTPALQEAFNFVTWPNEIAERITKYALLLRSRDDRRARRMTPTSERHFLYAVFYDNEQYKGVRQSVIIEHCEAEMFTSIDVPAPKQPTPSPTP